MSLVTVAQLKAYLPHIKSDSTAEDTPLGLFIARAEEQIARYCGYPAASAGGTPTMASTSYTLYVRARTPETQRGWSDADPVYRTLRLPVRPVTAVASVYSDPDEEYGSDDLVASSDYTLDGDAGELRLKPNSIQGGWSPEKRAQKVSCTAGFTSAPPALVHAICLTAAAMYKRRPEAGVERQSTADGASVEMEKGIPKEAREVLNDGFVLPGRIWGDE